MIFPYVKHPKKVGKGFLIGTVLGGAVLVMITFLCLVVWGPDFTSRNVYPSFILGKKINIADFIKRVEGIMAGLWFFTIFFKSGCMFLRNGIGVGPNVKTARLSPSSFPLKLYFSDPFTGDLTEHRLFSKNGSQIWSPFAATFGLFLPLILLVVAKIRKKGSSL
jgi:spore germination protein KB